MVSYFGVDVQLNSWSITTEHYIAPEWFRAFQNHLINRYPNGITARSARRELRRLKETAGSIPTA